MPTPARWNRSDTALKKQSVTAGFLSSFVLMRYLSSFLSGVTPADPVTFGIVAVVMLAAA
jgi:hypothetical protein